jgi:hypothetical protein
MDNAAEQTEELYDFLYRDHNRLNLYYSQIFQGKLISIEETDNSQEGTDTEAKLDTKLFGYKKTNKNSDFNQTKKTIDPIDMNAQDVLSHLSQNRIREDYQDAPFGSLVLVKGKLSFFDKNLLSVAAEGYKLFNENQSTKPNLASAAKHNKHKQNPQRSEEELGMQLIEKMIADGFIQPVFFIETEDGDSITGTIKEQGLEEPVSSYYIKFGGKGLSAVYCVGIKEETGTNEIIQSEMVTGMQHFTNLLSTLLVGDNAIRITPIALFRKIL